MLLPKKMKYRKQFRRVGKCDKVATSGTLLSFGQWGLKTTMGGLISARQIEAARRAMTRYIKREGQVWIRIFPDKPMTAQPAETGMGGGKGTVDHFVASVPAGKIVFEIGGVSNELAQEALRLAAHKLSVKTKFIKRF